MLFRCLLLFLNLDTLAAEGERFAGLLADEVLVQLFGVQILLDLTIAHFVNICHYVFVHQLEELRLIFHLRAGFRKAEIKSRGDIAVYRLLLLVAETCRHEVSYYEAVELI